MTYERGSVTALISSGAIGAAIAWMVETDARMTHGSIPMPVLVVIGGIGVVLAALIGSNTTIDRIAARYGEFWSLGSVGRLMTKAAFAACAALAWDLGVVVALRAP